jgi:hypothetical protein
MIFGEAPETLLAELLLLDPSLLDVFPCSSLLFVTNLLVIIVDEWTLSVSDLFLPGCPPLEIQIHPGCPVAPPGSLLFFQSSSLMLSSERRWRLFLIQVTWSRSFYSTEGGVTIKAIRPLCGNWNVKALPWILSAPRSHSNFSSFSITLCLIVLPLPFSRYSCHLRTSLLNHHIDSVIGAQYLRMICLKFSSLVSMSFSESEV